MKYKWRLLLGLVFVAISNVFAIVPAKIIRYAFDMVKENILIYQLFNGFSEQQEVYHSIFKLVLLFGFLVLGLAVAKGIFLFFMRQTIIVVSRLIEYDLKNEIYDQYQKLDTSFYKKNNTGDLMNRISEDVSRVRMYIGPAVMYTINLTILFVLVIFTMIQVNAQLTFYVLFPLPILSVAIYYVSHIIHKKSEKVQAQLSAISTFTQEAFSGIRVLKAYNRETDSFNSFEKECENYKDVNLDLVKTNALFQPMMLLLIGLSSITTIFIGGKLAINGEISIGNIAEFVIYVNMLTWPVAAVGWVTSLVQRAAASQKRINEFLSIQPKIVKTNNTTLPIQGTIEFKEVSFTYDDTNIEVFKNLSFKVEKGKSLAIIGKTGSGKSTIAALISRMYDAQSGVILIDKENIKNLNLNDLRKSIGYVPQETFLFSDTISNNIDFGNNNYDKKDLSIIKQAAKDAVIYDNIIALAEGFETFVGERGVTLSGGQKQRVSIARAIIKQPKILILDDCLSAVDTQTEEQIVSNLKRIMQNKTTVIVSHRISSIKHLDHIIVLENKSISEQGTHQELIDKKGFYFDLYSKQLLEDKK